MAHVRHGMSSTQGHDLYDFHNFNFKFPSSIYSDFQSHVHSDAVAADSGRTIRHDFRGRRSVGWLWAKGGRLERLGGQTCSPASAPR